MIEDVEQILRDAADKTCSEKRISVDHGPDFETVGIGSSFSALFSSCNESEIGKSEHVKVRIL